MKLELLDTFPAELDAVADASPRATFYHTGAWMQALADAYPRMSLRCLVARDGDAAVAYLPYFVSRRGPFSTLWSLPFGTYGGPVGVADDGACDELLRAYRRRILRPGVCETGWVDFRNARTGQAGETIESETHLVDISAGFEEVWNARYDKPRRRRVRRAEEAGITVHRAVGLDDVLRFFRVYRERLREWDTGAGHPERLFTSLVERGGERVRLYLACQGEEVLGGHLNLYYKEEVIAWYGMASARGGELQAGTLLYATCMREACEAGYRSYNLGSSLGKASLIDYKQSLGGVPYRYRAFRQRRLAARLAAALRRAGAS
jgi:CelD/BcsL family acetyltransferase involved in cellulose biosynthesis